LSDERKRLLAIIRNVDVFDVERWERIERAAAAVVAYWRAGDPGQEHALPHELELIRAMAVEGSVALEAKALPPSPGGGGPIAGE
jgi:hypothetical protein